MKEGIGAPVSFSTSTVFNSPSFSTKPIKRVGHGPGVRVCFNTFLCQVGSNGVTTNSDNLLPITLNGMWSAAANWLSGLTTTSGSNVSGIFVHPLSLGGRMFSECFNWSEWRPVRLKLTFQTSAPTSSSGMLMFGFNRDPTSLFECSQSAYLPNTSNMSQNTPLAVTSVYRDSSIVVTDFDPNKLYKCNTWQRLKSSPLGTTTGDLSYVMEESCGRFASLFYGIATSATPYGSFWISGEVEFYGPTYGSAVSSTIIVDGATYPLPSPPSDEKTVDIEDCHRLLSHLKLSGTSRCKVPSTSTSSSSSSSTSSPSSHLKDIEYDVV